MLVTGNAIMKTLRARYLKRAGNRFPEQIDPLRHEQPPRPRTFRASRADSRRRRSFDINRNQLSFAIVPERQRSNRTHIVPITFHPPRHAGQAASGASLFVGGPIFAHPPYA
jgi:hypothetical protein